MIETDVSDFSCTHVTVSSCSYIRSEVLELEGMWVEVQAACSLNLGARWR
jgi:hypothetical protein